MIKWKLYRSVKTKPKDLSYINRKRSFAPGFMYSIGSLFILGLFTIAPFILVISAAFNDNSFLTGDQAEYLLGTSNFDAIFADERFYIAMQNSFTYMAITVPGSLILSLIISWGISAMHRKYARGFWQSIFFVPYVTATVAISLSFAYIFDAGHGIINLIINQTGGKSILWLTDQSGVPELGAISIFGLWRNMAFDVLILSTAMMGVDRQLYKVSSIDGAKPFKQFLHITVPQVMPALFYLLTLSLIQSIKVFPLALFNNSAAAAFSAKGQSLLLYVYYFTNEISGGYGRAAASSIILAVLAGGVVFLARTLPRWIRRAYVIKTRKAAQRSYSFWKMFVLTGWNESIFRMNKLYRQGLVGN